MNISQIVSIIESITGHGSVNSKPPHSPRHLMGICNLKAMLQMPQGGARILVQIPTVELREDWKFPT